MSEQGNVEVNVNPPATTEGDDLNTGQNEPNVVADPPAATPDNPNPETEGEKRPDGDIPA